MLVVERTGGIVRQSLLQRSPRAKTITSQEFSDSEKIERTKGKIFTEIQIEIQIEIRSNMRVYDDHFRESKQKRKEVAWLGPTGAQQDAGTGGEPPRQRASADHPGGFFIGENGITGIAIASMIDPLPFPQILA